jgi:hypothetical protein
MEYCSPLLNITIVLEARQKKKNNVSFFHFMVGFFLLLLSFFFSCVLSVFILFLSGSVYPPPGEYAVPAAWQQAPAHALDAHGNPMPSALMAPSGAAAGPGHAGATGRFDYVVFIYCCTAKVCVCVCVCV